jgi:hypothetical protein
MKKELVEFIISLQKEVHVEEKILKFHGLKVETGSAITWKYPSCILQGDNSVGEFYSIAITNNFQKADTGTKDDTLRQKIQKVKSFQKEYQLEMLTICIEVSLKLKIKQLIQEIILNAILY